MNLCSTLSVKDVSSFYKLSVSSLGAYSLGLGISAVLCGTNSLFMIVSTPPRIEVSGIYYRIVLSLPVSQAAGNP